MTRCPAILPVLALLSGCLRLSQPAPEIREYRLDYVAPAVTDAPLPVILGVPALRVAAVYDRQAIVYREGENATGTDFYNRWSANPGAMVADLLARDLADSGAYRSVQRGPSLLPADYLLTGEIEEIEERVGPAGCTAHLRMRLTVARASGANDAVRLAKTYAGDEPCACRQPRALAASMSRALERISTQLQQDVYSAIASEQSAR